MLPSLASLYLPLLVSVQMAIWPVAPMPSFLAAQVEQETCISLKHPKCWNPRAELKTSREYGYGMAQTTIAYRSDGSVRFNKQEELRAAHASLRGWTFEKRYDPKYQLTALVEMNKAIFNRTTGSATEQDRLMFTLSAYNGGESGVRQDRILCRNTPGCDQSRWLSNVERTSTKLKVKFQGYGQSPYAINREYVRNVIFVRRAKYEQFFEGNR